jgi:hypothetical protein
VIPGDNFQDGVHHILNATEMQKATVRYKKKPVLPPLEVGAVLTNNGTKRPYVVTKIAAQDI